jgi:hypothetical protein
VILLIYSETYFEKEKQKIFLIVYEKTQPRKPIPFSQRKKLHFWLFNIFSYLKEQQT